MSTQLVDFVPRLPVDPVIKIFSYQNGRDLFACGLVSTKWKATVETDHIFRAVFSQALIPADQDAVQYIKQIAVTSAPEVMNLIADFARRLQVNQIGRFACTFPTNRRCFIALQFGYGENSQINTRAMTEHDLREQRVCLANIPANSELCNTLLLLGTGTRNITPWRRLRTFLHLPLRTRIEFFHLNSTIRLPTHYRDINYFSDTNHQIDELARYNDRFWRAQPAPRPSLWRRFISCCCPCVRPE